MKPISGNNQNRMVHYYNHHATLARTMSFDFSANVANHLFLMWQAIWMVIIIESVATKVEFMEASVKQAWKMRKLVPVLETALPELHWVETTLITRNAQLWEGGRIKPNLINKALLHVGNLALQARVLHL